MREQGVVGIEGLTGASDLGVVIADAQASAETQLGVDGAEAASRACALSSTEDILLVLAIFHSPFYYLAAPNGAVSPKPELLRR